MKYRQGVALVLTDGQGRVLVCERASPRGVWQFPQGGIEPGETPEQAFWRELGEELGTQAARILKVGAATTFYSWPAAMRRAGEALEGQEHHWFLAQFLPGQEPCLERGDGSFVSAEWIEPAQAVARTVDWKRDSVRRGINILNLE